MRTWIGAISLGNVLFTFHVQGSHCCCYCSSFQRNNTRSCHCQSVRPSERQADTQTGSKCGAVAATLSFIWSIKFAVLQLSVNLHTHPQTQICLLKYSCVKFVKVQRYISSCTRCCTCWDKRCISNDQQLPEFALKKCSQKQHRNYNDI